jgi:DNA-binding MarR family transcriptional regulator
VPQALGRLRVALEDSFLRASRDVGLTSQQAELLCAVMQPAAVGDLAQTLRCDRSNASRLIDRAAARGFLTRRADEEDGRVTVVELTPKGKDVARRFLAGLESQTDSLKNRWSGQRRQLVVGLLNDLSDTLDAAKQPLRQRKHRRFASR